MELRKEISITFIMHTEFPTHTHTHLSEIFFSSFDEFAYIWQGLIGQSNVQAEVH